MLNKEQEEALSNAIIFKSKLALSDSTTLEDYIYLISGMGGSGKTYVAKAIITNLQKLNKSSKILLIGPTWNAVYALKNSLEGMDVTITTLAAALGTDVKEGVGDSKESFILYSNEKLDDLHMQCRLPDIFEYDILIIDEASMIGGSDSKPRVSKDHISSSDSYRSLEYRLKQRETYGKPPIKFILLLGDHCQIPPIGTVNDYDAYIIEYLLDKPNQHSILTTNMRSGKEDIAKLHFKYRDNIEKARSELKTGKVSNKSIFRNPMPYKERISSDNVVYISKFADAVDMFCKIYNNDITNFKNVVYIIYNNSVNAHNAFVTNAIRKKLFGVNINLPYNVNEFLISIGSINASWVNPYTNVEEETVLPNETRMLVTAVKEGVKTIKKVWNKGQFKNKPLDRTYNINGYFLDVLISYKSDNAKCSIFVPRAKELLEKFGTYDNYYNAMKTTLNGKVLLTPYGLYSEVKKELAIVEYGYVVNTHKVQGSTYSNVIVDEYNILSSPTTNKEYNQLMYTAVSRPSNKVYIFNIENPK